MKTIANNYGLNYAGIGSTTNMDPDTGIRYGVIPDHAVGQAWYEDSEPEYGQPYCPQCGNEIEETEDGEYHCDHCDKTMESDEIWDMVDPVSHVCTDHDLSAEKPYDDPDIWVLYSKYYTHAQFCSPCAPGACYLLNPTDQGGPRAYCFGHDWFESGKAPYPVYSVETGKLVEPNQA